jgi:hypothetical protein
MTITSGWIDAALALRRKDLQLMEQLVRRQLRRS